MLRTRLTIIIALIGVVGAAMFSGSSPVSAGAQTPSFTVTVSANPITPGGSMTYTITPTDVSCTLFQVRGEDANDGIFLNTDPFIGPGTSASFPAPSALGTASITVTGANGICNGASRSANFSVAVATTTAAPTTAAPTTAAPTTVAPSTTAAAAVPPAPPTTTAPTTTAVAPAAAPAALPATGQELDLAVVALLLCLGGGGLVVATRRR